MPLRDDRTIVVKVGPGPTADRHARLPLQA
jgi:hypothetical protein